VLRKWIFAVLALLCLPTPAYAHVDVQAGAGFLAGLLHPVFGLDHFLAMLSVGIVSAQLGGQKVFTIPALFVLSMIAGAVAGLRGQAWAFGEAGGFVTSTTLIHLLGVAIGHGLNQRATLTVLLRHMGSAMAGMGLMILLGSMAP